MYFDLLRLMINIFLGEATQFTDHLLKKGSIFKLLKHFQALFYTLCVESTVL